MSRRDEFHLRAYRSLLYLLPRSVRSRQGAHMERLFGDMWREHRGAGALRRLSFWWSAVADVLRAAAQARLAGRAQRRASATSSVSPPYDLAPEARRSAARSPSMWNDLIQDICYALRSLRHNAAFFATAVLIVGIGVGGSTAIFSVVNPMLLRSLPFEEPDRLVWIANSDSGGLSSVTSRASNLADYRRLNRSFEQLTGYFAFFDYMGYNLTGSGEPERLVGVPVAQDFLDVLGVQPLLGRDFPDEQSFWGGSPTVILSHGFWQRRYAADPDVVGRIINLNNQPTEVIGVLPAWFDFASFFTPGARIDFLTVFPISEETDQMGDTLVMIGRMRAGVSVDEVQAELDLMNRQLQEADPERWGLEAVATGLQEKITGRFTSAMLLLAGAAGLVMVIVCANLSNLLLARAAERRKEIAVRGAMGASRTRLIRQMLTESVLLSACGGALGVVLAVVITEAVAGASAIDMPLLHGVAVDGAALLFTSLLALLAGVLFGIAPALEVSIGSEHAALADTSRGSSVGRRGAWLREALVVSEVALACILLIGGGLLMRSFFAVLDVDLGFQSEGAYAWRIDTDRQFDSDPEKLLFFEQLVRDVEAVPGVTAAGLSDTLPLGRNRGWGVAVPGVDYGDAGIPTALPRMIDHRYLETMRIPLIDGRYFGPEDTSETENLIIVNETMARAVFPEGPALNRVLIALGEEFRVVGVVADVRHSSLEEASGNEMYIPINQQPVWWDSLELVVRSGLPPESLAGGVKSALQRADPDLPATEFRSLGDIVDRAVSPRRFILLLIEAFALTALLLASLGIYGVLSYSVNRRAVEMGIRMALGASAARLQCRVVGRTLAMATIGIAIGWIGALALSRLLASLLYGVAPTDPLTFAGVTALLLVIAALAGYFPARRASRIDPTSVLNS